MSHSRGGREYGYFGQRHRRGWFLLRAEDFLGAHMAHEDEARGAAAIDPAGDEKFDYPSARHVAERLVEVGLLVCWLFIAAKYLLGVI